MHFCEKFTEFAYSVQLFQILYYMSVKQNYFNNDRLHVEVQVAYFYP